MSQEHLACSESELTNRRSVKLKLGGREIFIVKTGGAYFALDAFCYHAGGPLYQGDIEDFGGRTCMVCPWHKYKVCVDTGQNYFQSVDPKNLKSVRWTAGDVRQRTHAVNVRDGNIYVTLTIPDGTLDSDRYNKDTDNS